MLRPLITTPVAHRYAKLIIPSFQIQMLPTINTRVLVAAHASILGSIAQNNTFVTRNPDTFAKTASTTSSPRVP
jgi:hypothetical protein